jgi:radical SAM superfamily enzyme YgiQ (UPF0313 family)
MEKVHCIILTGNSQFRGGVKTSGAYRIASELRKNGYNTKVIDMTVFHGFDEDIQNLLSSLISTDTLWIGISYNFLKDIFGVDSERVTPVTLTDGPVDQDLIDFIRFCRKLNPNIKIIAGGYKKFVWKVYGIHYFAGYSDETIVDYTNWCAKKAGAQLSYHLGETKSKEFDKFVTSQITYTDSDIMLPGVAVPIELSRGCIFKCKFCAFPLNGKTKGEWIKRTDVLRSELLYNYERFGITDYIFADDTHNDSTDKLRLFYDEVYSKLPFKINFSSYLRLDLLMRFPEQVQLLKESGLRSAVFGIETLNPKSAKIIGKGVNPQEQLAFLRDIKNGDWKNQVLTSSGWIIGLPADNIDTAAELREFLWSKDNPLDHWSISPLYIKPKHLWFEESMNMTTEFEKNYEKYGYEFPEYNSFSSINWENKKNGLSFKLVSQQVINLTDRNITHPNWHFGGFAAADVASCGVSYDDLVSRTAHEIFKMQGEKKLGQMKYEKGVEYKAALMNHYRLPLVNPELPELQKLGLRGTTLFGYRDNKKPKNHDNNEPT